jgi:enoyl-CoA hydratase
LGLTDHIAARFALISGVPHIHVFNKKRCKMAYNTILTDTKSVVGVITLNRPDALNALNSELITELAQALDGFESNDAIGAIVITGSVKAFAAGADIKEMQPKTYQECYKQDFMAGDWTRISHCRKPVIAAVSGYALGGGCELAMMCDMIFASDTAKFGQPEITLGVMPGIGGTQRLTRAIGKAKAMDLCLTGRMMDAKEAESAGLVARIIPSDDLMSETLKAACKIAEFSRPAISMNKETINKTFEMTLEEGLKFERRLFHAMFATNDQKEGMAAFIAKRKPQFIHS